MNRSTPFHRPRRRLTSTAACAALFAVGIVDGSIRAQLPIVPIPLSLSQARAIHVANRLTFGQTEALVNQISGPIANYFAYLNAQLTPNFANDNADVTSLLGQVNNNQGMPSSPGFTTGLGYAYDDIQNGVFVYSAVSDFQLAARMGYFWERHFNTYANRVRNVVTANYAGGNIVEGESLTCLLEWQDYEYYRQNAFGSFRDLVGHTFYSPAMLIYLDTIFNDCVAGSGGMPNENMSRELQELHMIGTHYAITGDLNYDTPEIQAIAAIMSGWGLRGTGYGNLVLTAQFNPNDHCGQAVSIYGSHAGLPAHTTVPGIGGVDDLLDYLVTTDACKDFICRKLMVEFLGDSSPADYPQLVASMKSAWGPTGNIQAVLYTMLSSGEFLSLSSRWSRAKTPTESAVAHARIWGGSFRDTPTSLNPNLARLDYVRRRGQLIGEFLFLFPSPDGFPLESNEQPGSGIMLKTLTLFTESYYTNEPYAGASVRFDFPGFVMGALPPADWDDPRDIATLFLTRAYGTGWTQQQYNAVAQAIGKDVNGVLTPLVPSSPGYGKRLAQGVMATMSMPRAFLR